MDQLVKKINSKGSGRSRSVRTLILVNIELVEKVICTKCSAHL